MKLNLWIAAAVAAVLLFMSSTYVVREGHVGIVLNLGRVIRADVPRTGEGGIRVGVLLAVAGGTTQLEAVIDRAEGSIRGDVMVRNLDLAHVDVLQGTSRPFRGVVDLEGELSHLASDPTLKGRVTMMGAAWGEIPIGNAAMSLQHVGRKATLSGNLLSGRAEGIIAVETHGPVL